MKRPRAKKEAAIIGWRELIDLPEIGIRNIRAKVDTGARTSALHAVDIEPTERDGAQWIRFRVPLSNTDCESPHILAPVHDRRAVKNTSGVPEERWIIRTLMHLGTRRWPIQLSLADRENMGFDIILGRTAIRGRRVLVNPGRSYLAGAPAVGDGDELAVRTDESIVLVDDFPS